MRHDPTIKMQAQKLRAKGKTYSEIQKILRIHIPGSTISTWCGKIPMPAWFEKKLVKLNNKNLSKAQKMAWIVNKKKQEEFLNGLKRQNIHLLKKMRNRDIFKTILAFLYLGEGSKWKSRRGLMLGNANPEVIKLYLRLLRFCYGIESKTLKIRISYRADQDIKKLERYWSKITSIPLRNFYKTKPDPRTIGKPTQQKNYHGVCCISGGSTRVQLELETIPKIVLMGL